jgi:hypothetical protein
MSSTPSPIPAEVLNQMSETDRIRALELLTELDHRNTRAAAQKDFIKFVERMWPEFIPGRHHAKMARAFEKIAQGKLKRLIINMPPRHTKSEFASYLLPAWFLGLYPNKQIMQISHTADMAEGFGRKVRNLVDSDNYHTIFPDTRLRRDSTAAARWNTDKNGTYIAMGVGGAVAGKGADLCLAKESIVDNGRQLQIKDIQIGDVIKTNTGWEKVTNKSLTTHDSYVILNHDVRASKTHPFMTDRGWVEAGELNIGDKILTITIWRQICTLLKTLLEKRGKE